MVEVLENSANEMVTVTKDGSWGPVRKNHELGDVIDSQNSKNWFLG